MAKRFDSHIGRSQVRFANLRHEAALYFSRRNEPDLWRDFEQAGLKVVSLRECAHAIWVEGCSCA